VLSLKSEYDFLHRYNIRHSKTSELLLAITQEKYLEESNQLITLPSCVTTFLSSQVYTSLNYLKDLQQEGVALTAEDACKLLAIIKEINSKIRDSVTEIRKEETLNELLNGIVTPKTLAYRLDFLDNLTIESISIMKENWPNLGQIIQSEHSVQISINGKALDSIANFTSVYIHEASHYLSGATDFTENFNQFMMLLYYVNSRKL
jgi:hypothetical protein